MSAPRLEDALVDHLATGSTGVLDVRAGKKRWLLYVADGALVGSKSNLKSEQAAAIRGGRADLSEGAVMRAQAIRRLRNALMGGESWAFKAGSAPAEVQSLPTAAVLVRAVMGARDAATLEAALAPVLAGQPRLSGAPEAAGASRTVAPWLAGLDGTAGGQERLAAAPGKPGEAAATLWVAWKLGALEVDAADAAAAETDQAAAPAAGGFDLGALIAAQVAAPTAPPAPGPLEAAEQARPTRGPPVSLDDLPTVEVPEEPPPEIAAQIAAQLRDPNAAPPAEVAPPAEADAARPDPTADIAIEAIAGQGASQDAGGSSHVVSLPRFTQRAAPEPAAPAPRPKHPKEDALRTLHERVTTAENHFEVLDVLWDSPVDAFRTAHLELAGQLHPDRFTDAPAELQELAHEAFDRVRAAWEELSEDEARQAYIDKVIHGRKTEEELAMEQVEAYWTAEADFKRGLAAFNNGRVAAAHDLFQAAVDRVPEELEFRAYAAFTGYQTARSRDPEAAEQAKELLKDVLERNKEQERKLDGAWVLLGRIYREEGNDKAAKRCFVQALRINASNADATRELRRLSGGSPGQKKGGEDKKKGKKGGFFSGLFGKKSKK